MRRPAQSLDKDQHGLLGRKKLAPTQSQLAGSLTKNASAKSEWNGRNLQRASCCLLNVFYVEFMFIYISVFSIEM